MHEPTFGLCSSAHVARLKTLRERIAPILANRILLHFTDHSVDHSDRVVQLAEELALALPSDKRLSSDEAFILYAACYIHDVGMHNESAGLHGRLAQTLAKSGTTWSELSEGHRRDLLRDHHHEVSADMVVASRRLPGSGYTSPPIGLALDDTDFPGEVAAVAESHAIDVQSPRYSALVAPGGSRRLRLLSALLRLADILDEAQHRALRSKAETLMLDEVSLTHWWRHYYTREVVIDATNSMVTVFFEFPENQEDEYASVIPELQIPWVRREFERHKEVFAANRLNWVVKSTVRYVAFAVLDSMPSEVMVQMLRMVADQRAADALASRQALIDYEEKARTFGNQQIRSLNDTRDGRDATAYLRDMERATLHLHNAGGTISAIVQLRSAIHYSTKNGRSADAHVHVSAAITLGRLLIERDDCRGAMLALMDGKNAAESLPTADPSKAHFYCWLAKASFVAGHFPDGRDAANKSLELLPAGPERADLEAQLEEAIMLEGLDREDGAYD